MANEPNDDKYKKAKFQLMLRLSAEAMDMLDAQADYEMRTKSQMAAVILEKVLLGKPFSLHPVVLESEPPRTPRPPKKREPETPPQE